MAVVCTLPLLPSLFFPFNSSRFSLSVCVFGDTLSAGLSRSPFPAVCLVTLRVRVRSDLFFGVWFSVPRALVRCVLVLAFWVSH